MGSQQGGRGRRGGRGPFAWGITGTSGLAIAVALGMVLGPAMGSAVVPPFKGAVSKTNSVYWYGCAKPKLTHATTFSLKTGRGAFAGTVAATDCAKSQYGVGSQSDAEINGMFSAVIPLKVPGGTTNISMDFHWSEAWTSAIAWTGTCPTQSYFLPDPSNASLDRNLTSGYCDIASVVDTDGNAAIADETNGTYFDMSGMSGCGVTCIFNSYNGTENSTDIYYGCYGPASAPSSCWSYNSTYQTSSLLSSSNVSSGTGTWWFNATGPSWCPGCNPGWTFNPHHKYVLFVDLDMDAIATMTGWRHGSAKTDFNMASGGNGFQVTSIGFT